MKEERELTLYEILDVPDGASREEVRRAYYALAKKYHPDLHLTESEEVREYYAELFRKIIWAYLVLDNPYQKLMYDFEGERPKKPETNTQRMHNWVSNKIYDLAFFEEIETSEFIATLVSLLAKEITSYHDLNKDMLKRKGRIKKITKRLRADSPDSIVVGALTALELVIDVQVEKNKDEVRLRTLIKEHISRCEYDSSIEEVFRTPGEVVADAFMDEHWDAAMEKIHKLMEAEDVQELEDEQTMKFEDTPAEEYHNFPNNKEDNLIELAKVLNKHHELNDLMNKTEM